jgi:hypothetical protein
VEVEGREVGFGAGGEGSRYSKVWERIMLRSCGGWGVSLGLDLCLSLGRLGGGLRGGGRETGGEEGEEEDGGGRRRGRYRISAFELA